LAVPIVVVKFILWQQQYNDGNRELSFQRSEGCLSIRPPWARGQVRMRSSFYACVLPVRPVRAFKAVLLEDRLKSFYGCSYRLNRFLFFVHTAKKKSTLILVKRIRAGGG